MRLPDSRACVPMRRETARLQDLSFHILALGDLSNCLTEFSLQQSIQLWMTIAARVETVIKSSILDRPTVKAAHMTLHAGKKELCCPGLTRILCAD